jgi:hypothetical protein
MNETKEILSRRETADLLGICLTSLNKLSIPKTQIRRRVFYRRATIENWLQTNETAREAQPC